MYVEVQIITDIGNIYISLHCMSLLLQKLLCKRVKNLSVSWESTWPRKDTKSVQANTDWKGDTWLCVHVLLRRDDKVQWNMKLSVTAICQVFNWVCLLEFFLLWWIVWKVWEAKTTIKVESLWMDSVTPLYRTCLTTILRCLCIKHKTKKECWFFYSLQ